MKIFFSIFFIFFVFLANAQHNPDIFSNLRKKNIAIKDSVVNLDSLSIIPNTFTIQNIHTFKYTIDEINARLIWLAKPDVDSITIVYRVYPFRLNKVYRHFNYDSIRNNFLAEKPFVYKHNNNTANPVFDFGNLNYNGSIGRGLSFGNSQDAVVNSSLNLQLSGYLGDSLQISAAITDNNIPIQPDGNTQRLNDFDKILVQVRKAGWQASFGDIDLRQNKNYFLNFYKRLQGASYSTVNQFRHNISNSFLVSGSIAKGKFNTNNLTPSDGNQGPYRLKGANNELYFTILAGTEKIYIDGILLQRGEEQDYVINYNTAELTFTSKRMITKDMRIRVEFEYADRNYLNSNIYVNNEVSFNKKFTLGVSVFSNQDAKNSSIDQTLDAKQKQFLSNAGSNIENTYYPSGVKDTFAIGKILYRKTDTVYNTNIHDSVFLFTSNSSDTVYSVSFTYLGAGKGNYVQQYDATNGKVYKWISPDANNIKQGDWAPVMLLVTPKKHQVANITAEYKVNSKTTVKTDLAVSNYDVNLFSGFGKQNDVGYAARLEVDKNKMPLTIFNKKITYNASLGYENVQRYFKPLERLRTVEFNRDWNLSNDATPADEHLSNGMIELNSRSGNMLRYELGNYVRSDNFIGFRHLVDISGKWREWNIVNKISYTTTDYNGQKGTFLRPNVDINKTLKKIKKIKVGANYYSDRNIIKTASTNILSSSSFSFNVWQFYLKSNESKLNKWGIAYNTRNDLLPFNNVLTKANSSNNISMFSELMKNENQQWKFNVTYRKLHIANSLLSSQLADESLLGRTEYFVKAMKGMITGNVLYELGAGQEQKREFTYVEVPAGQGEYTWIDYNGDGVAQLNEFEVAQFSDQKKYIKINTPTNQYVKANYLQFNYHIELNPKALFTKKIKNKFLKVLSKTNFISALQINKKDISTGKFEFNPFANNLIDTTLLTETSFLSNTLYFNRTNSKWGFDLTQSTNRSKSLLTYGFESRNLQNLSLKTRWNITRNFYVNWVLKHAINSLNTPSFDNRNYLFKEKMVEPSISYMNGSKFRATVSYGYDNKKNDIGYSEQTVNQLINAEVKYSVLSSSTLSGKLSMQNISFTSVPSGSPNSTVGYVMLDGLLPGKNYIWNLELIKRIAGNLELNFQYDGRKTANARTIHTGRASIRAIF